MLVFWKRRKPENPEKKPLGTEKRTNNKFNPHLTLCPGIEPGTNWLEASALTTAPSLLPLILFDMALILFALSSRLKTLLSRNVDFV